MSECILGIENDTVQCLFLIYRFISFLITYTPEKYPFHFSNMVPSMGLLDNLLRKNKVVHAQQIWYFWIGVLSLNLAYGHKK